MDLWDRFELLWHGSHARLRSLSRDVVLRSHADVLERLKPHVWTMSRAEQRGYVRARAARVVNREVHLLLSEVCWVPAGRLQRELVQRSTEEIVVNVVSGLSQRPGLAPQLKRAS